MQKYLSCDPSSQIDNNQLGFSLSSFLEPVQDLIQDSVYDPIKESVQSVTTEEQYEQISSGVTKLTDKAVEKGEEMVAEQVAAYAAQPDVQQQAAAGAFDAAAAQAKQVYMNVVKTAQEGGIVGVFKKYPIPFYVTGGLVGLLTLRFLLGGRKKVYIQTQANPKRRTKKSSKRRSKRK